MQPLAQNDPRTAGEFRLSARLGLGGMGRVFLGYSPAGRAVAVKVCHPDLAADQGFVRRFAREVAAAQAVNGLYTAQVVAAGPYDDPPWLATDYVPGPSLQDYVEAFGPLPEPAVWRLATGLAEALQAVHASGLVHRDLKPTNVLLATDGPRVIDFGIASALDATALTTAGSTLGSPSYMSPEQALGRPVGPASDVFALGSTVVFAATGSAPFGGGDAPGVLFRVVHTEPALDPLPGRLYAVVAACLAKDPANRPTLPQLLHACQAAAAASGGSATSFWPAPVTAAIARYQDGPVRTAPPPTEPVPSAAPTAVATWPPVPRWSGSRWSGTTVALAIGRRRVLAGLGGLAVAGGLAAAGVELTRSGRGGPSSGADRLAWVHRTGGPVSSSPALSGGALYVGSDDGTVYALDAATGNLEGTYPAGGAVSGGVAVADGTLFAGGAGGKVLAFAVGNGGVSWAHQTGAAVATAPAPAGGLVYAGSDDHYVYALDTGTGQLKWRTATGGAVRFGPAEAGQPPADGVVWAGSEDGTMYALNAATGAVEWRFAVGGAVDSGPLVVSGNAYFGGRDARLYSLSFDPFDGSKQVLWQFTADGAIRGTPAYTGETVYVGSASSEVYALGLDGTPIWSYRTGGPVSSGPAVGGGVLYVGSDDQYLYAIDTFTGAALWRYRAGGPIRSTIVVAGGLVYFGCLDHRVYALHT